MRILRVLMGLSVIFALWLAIRQSRPNEIKKARRRNSLL